MLLEINFERTFIKVECGRKFIPLLFCPNMAVGNLYMGETGEAYHFVMRSISIVHYCK